MVSWILKRVSRQIGEKNFFPQIVLDIHMQKNEVGPLPLCELGLFSGFLDMTPKSTKKQKIDNLDFTKI